MNDALTALRAGQAVILPTDTVYGLCASAAVSGPSERMYRVKGRDPLKPSTLVASDLEQLLECIPELRGRAEVIASALLPGPYTLVFPNPARRYRWLTGENQDSIGVRVPDLPEPTRSIVGEAGCIAATSANLPGGKAPRRLDEIPAELLEAVGAVVDGGELPGTPSTIIDFSGDEPRVLREGAASSSDALERVAVALA